MTPEHWQRVKDLLHSALDREPAERAAFLDEACAGDDALRREVESLLASHEEAADFFETSALEDVTKVMAGDGAEAMAGRIIGRYRVVSQLGAGGMGEVYLAEDTELGRRVALKLLPPHFAADDKQLRRFRQEARAASALNHPNILTIHEIGQEGSTPFIATEYIEGETLRQRMTRAPLKLEDVLDIATQVASALSAAHQAGITHRDIKPENVMIRSDRIVKVLDFGLAKPTGKQSAGRESPTLVNTSAGIVMGTVAYMSPEQVRGLQVDARTDIWSLGVLLYEMLAKRVPFEGETAGDFIAAILEREPPPLARYAPEVPTELEWITAKALRKDREERYQTAKELLTDLKGLKQRLEFEAELDRTAPPEAGGRTSGRTTAVSTARGAAGARPASGRTGASGSSARRTRKAIDSLAVLPFANACDDPGMEYLSDGITESLINSLAQLPRLRVVPRSTVFRYKGREADALAAGRELNARAVVTGRVCQVGDTLMIQAELIDVANESQLWGERYNREMADIFEVQEEIAREISEKLQVRLTKEQRKRLSKRPTKNTEAYQAYLKGRHSWNKRTEEGLRRAVEYFEEAIRIDPAYAQAYAGLADAYALPGIAEYGLLPPHEAMPKAKAAALRALELDPTLAEAQTTLAHVRAFYDWDWVSAEGDFKRAIALDPNYAFSHHWYALYLAAMGRGEEAIAEERRAQEIDPLSLVINKNVGTILYYAGQLDEAVGQYRKALELDPEFARTHIFLGMAYARKGMHEEALAEYQRSLALSGENTVVRALYGHALASSGRRAEALKVLDELKGLRAQKYVPAFNIALVYAGLGEKDRAFEWLERAYEERSSWLVSLGVEPLFDSLRTDPRFADHVRRVGPTDGARSGPHAVTGEEKRADTSATPTRPTGQAAPAASRGVPRALRRPVTLAAAGLLLVAALAAALVYFRAPRQAAGTAAGAPVKSVAVLPFKPMGVEGDDGSLRLGMADALITKLSNIRQITVRPTSAVRKYIDEGADPVAAGRELKVDAVLEGSVQRAGDQIRVTVQLVRVQDGAPLWAGKFDTAFAGVFALQDSISDDVARALTLRLTGEERARLMKRYTENTEAYQSYLKGRYLWNKRARGSTKERLNEAIGHFEQAISIDPNYALAYTGIADCYAVLGGNGLLRPHEALPKEKAAAEKALEIDDALAEAHTSLAHYSLHNFEWANAEREFLRAIELNPSYATAHHWLSLYLVATGRFDEAIAAAKRAQELDPLSPVITLNIGYALYRARRYDQAIEHFQRILDSDPNRATAHAYIGYSYMGKGVYEEGVARLRKAVELTGGDDPGLVAALGHAYAVAGRRDEARKLIGELKEKAKQEYISSYHVAEIYAGLGEKDRAFEWLEKAYEERYVWLIYLKVEPEFDGLHSDPRFQDMVRRIGLT